MSGPGAVVVGSGFGVRVHVPALRAAGFQVLAIVGTDREKTSRRAGRIGVQAFTNLSDAIDMPGVEAVTVATPPSTHRDIVLACVAAGKHVLCEKPFALDAGEARAMQDAARAAGVVGVVGHEFRFLPERALVARLISEGAVGKPRLATFVSTVDLVASASAAMPRWWFDPSRGGGWLGASGSHLVDQVRTWLGEIEWVFATLGLVSDRPLGSAEDSFAVLFGTRSGAEGIMQQTGGSYGAGSAVSRVSGPAGSVWLDGGTVRLAGEGVEQVVEVPEDLLLAPQPPPSDDDRHRFSHLELGPFTRLATAWRAAIERRAAGPEGAPGSRLGPCRDPGPLHDPVPATFADGMAAMQVLDAIRRSARSGERVLVAGRGS